MSQNLNLHSIASFASFPGVEGGEESPSSSSDMTSSSLSDLSEGGEAAILKHEEKINNEEHNKNKINTNRQKGRKCNFINKRSKR
jgi:hypothetical protein